MNKSYLDTIVMVERLHRLFLDVLKAELDRQGIRDITNVQCFMLYNIGDKEVTIGELTQRGYYLGSNVTYNLRNLIENGYVNQKKSERDKRSSYISLTKKGIDLQKKTQAILENHVESLKKQGGIPEDLSKMLIVLRGLEVFWSTLLATPSRSRAA